MKTAAFVLCYNESLYLGYTIRSLIDWVDEVLIVEGAWKYLVRQGYSERSTDGTLDIIDNYIKEYPNVFVKYANEEECTKQYQIAIDWCKEREVDWGILVDADEIYPRDMQVVISSTINRTPPEVFQYRTHSLNFINDFSHYYNGLYPRIYRITEDAICVHENRIAWPKNGREHDRMQPSPPFHIKEINPAFKFFHYSYVKPRRDIERRFQYMWATGGSPNKALTKEYYIDENGLYHIPEDLKIYKFTGNHPHIIRGLVSEFNKTGRFEL